MSELTEAGLSQRVSFIQNHSLELIATKSSRAESVKFWVRERKPFRVVPVSSGLRNGSRLRVSFSLRNLMAATSCASGIRGLRSLRQRLIADIR